MATNFGETLDDVDTAAVAAEIGSDLFGGNTPAASDDGLGDGETVTEEVAEPPVKTELAQPAPVAEVNPAIVSGENSVGRALPKSWKKDMAPLWEKMDPGVREYVYEREANVMRGIQQYSEGYQAWNNLVSPFKPLLEANPDVNPIMLMQGLMATHLQLMNPSAPAAQKQQLVQGLLKEYGITLGAQEEGGNPSIGAVDPAVLHRLQQTESELAAIKRERQQAEQQRYQDGVKSQLAVVDAFMADPANKYFDEVADNIFHLIKTGAAKDLPEAYALACYANPGVRAKVIADQQATAVPAVDTRKRDKAGKFINLDEAEVKPKAVKPGSIDDTINAVVASHYTKH